MDETFSGELTRVLAQSRPGLADQHRLEFRALFGATGAYVDGRIFASCGRFGIALKLPSETRDALFREDGVERLKYFPRGHVKKEYAVLPEGILGDAPRFGRLVDESVAYVLA